MRALVFDKTLTYDSRRAEPVPGDGDTLLRVRQAGICSTDLEITKGYMGFRGILGHEFVADVVSSPDKDLVGQRVRAQIKVGSRPALVVPRRYVVTRFGVDYARLVGPGNTVSETPVQTTAGPIPA